MDENRRAIFAAGCFWGVEDKFSKIPGVTDVKSGYIGGTTEDPTYETVCRHNRTRRGGGGLVMLFDKLVDFFFQIHDPSTKDRLL